MPTYDYQCRQCGTTYEVIHSMREEGPTTCERCGGELRRVLYPSGIIFKGSGFYSTDARSASGTRRGSTPSAPTKDGTPGTGEGSAAKPADAGGAAPSSSAD